MNHRAPSPPTCIASPSKSARAQAMEPGAMGGATMARWVAQSPSPLDPNWIQTGARVCNRTPPAHGVLMQRFRRHLLHMGWATSTLSRRFSPGRPLALASLAVPPPRAHTALDVLHRSAAQSDSVCHDAAPCGHTDSTHRTQSCGMATMRMR